MAKRSRKLSTKRPQRSKSSSRKTMKRTKRQPSRKRTLKKHSSKKHTLKKHSSKKRKSRTKSIRKRKKTKKIMRGGNFETQDWFHQLPDIDELLKKKRDNSFFVKPSRIKKTIRDYEMKYTIIVKVDINKIEGKKISNKEVYYTKYNEPYVKYYIIMKKEVINKYFISDNSGKKYTTPLELITKLRKKNIDKNIELKYPIKQALMAEVIEPIITEPSIPIQFNVPESIVPVINSEPTAGDAGDADAAAAAAAAAATTRTSFDIENNHGLLQEITSLDYFLKKNKTYCIFETKNQSYYEGTRDLYLRYKDANGKISDINTTNNKLDLILDKIKELNKDGFNIVKPDRSKYIKDRIEKLVKLYDYDEDTKAKILVKYNETKETGVTLIDAIYSKEFKEEFYELSKPIFSSKKISKKNKYFD